MLEILLAGDPHNHTNSNKSTDSKGVHNNAYNSAGIVGDVSVGGCQWTSSTCLHLILIFKVIVEKK